MRDFEKVTLNSEEETKLQYEYMEKAKAYVTRLAEELGRTPTFHVQTFGCQMNARDSEKLVGILEGIGYQEIDDEHADFVIYNTCTVRENANNKVYGRLGYLSNYKKKNPHMMIALCGCMMQEPTVVEKIRTSYRFVNLIFGTHNIYKFAELLCNTFESKSMIVDIWKDTDKIVEDLPIKRKFSFKSGVNIMFGCNNFCSYCIVPYVRGRERSREPEKILEEVNLLAKEGYKEITLLGQNVNSYKGDEKIKNSIDEYILIEKSDSQTSLLRNEYGKLVEQVVNKEGWAVIDKFRYKRESSKWNRKFRFRDRKSKSRFRNRKSGFRCW